MAEQTIDNAKQTAMTAAMGKLREAHREEFLDLIAVEYKERGLGEYKPRRTAKERAADELARIKAEFPDLF